MPHKPKVLAVRFLAGGSIRSVSQSGAITWTPVSEETIPPAADPWAMSRDGRIIVTARAHTRNMAPQIRIAVKSQPPAQPIPMLFDWAAVAVANDGTIFHGTPEGRIYRSSIEEPLDGSQPILEDEASSITAIAVGPHGRLAWASGARVFVGDGRRVRELASAPHWVIAMAFGSDDDTLVAGDFSGTVTLWHLRTNVFAPIATFHREHAVKAVAISSDGRYVAAAGGSDRTPQLASVWPVADPQRSWTLPTEEPMSLAFEPLGDSILVGSANGMANVWSHWRERPVEVARFTHASQVLLAGFSEDGRYVITVSDEGEGYRRLWNNDALIAAACQRVGKLCDSGELAAYNVVCAGVDQKPPSASTMAGMHAARRWSSVGAKASQNGGLAAARGTLPYRLASDHVSSSDSRRRAVALGK
jgi:WD40 repeat protein